jgi:hypothetical protein
LKLHSLSSARDPPAQLLEGGPGARARQRPFPPSQTVRSRSSCSPGAPCGAYLGKPQIGFGGPPDWAIRAEPIQENQPVIQVGCGSSSVLQLSVHGVAALSNGVLPRAVSWIAHVQ